MLYEVTACYSEGYTDTCTCTIADLDHLLFSVHEILMMFIDIPWSSCDTSLAKTALRIGIMVGSSPVSTPTTGENYNYELHA